MSIINDSPGGQGDAITTRRFVADRTPNPEHRQDVLDGCYDSTDWFGHVQAALAARQPVAVRVTPEMRAAFRGAFRDGGFWADRLDTALDAMMRAAPPAQETAKAVDLGQFRQPVQDWLDDAQASMEEHGDYDGIFGYAIEEGTRLLALIDSQSNSRKVKE